MEGDLLIETIFILGQHFNPLPPHGGRPHCRHLSGLSTYNFNPLPPHGGRLCGSSLDSCSRLFQSTPSAWRETLRSFCRLAHWNISIHSLRMEGDTHQKSDRKERDISIHSLRMEGDKNFLSMTSCNCIFQSTPSAWRETQERCQIVFPAMDFNPLPPHGGRPFPSMVVIYNGYFNPLPPHGGRHDNKTNISPLYNLFQSTPSAWRETLRT